VLGALADVGVTRPEVELRLATEDPVRIRVTGALVSSDFLVPKELATKLV
jgi:hypothetical protein